MISRRHALQMGCVGGFFVFNSGSVGNVRNNLIFAPFMNKKAIFLAVACSVSSILIIESVIMVLGYCQASK